MTNEHIPVGAIGLVRGTRPRIARITRMADGKLNGLEGLNKLNEGRSRSRQNHGWQNHKEAFGPKKLKTTESAEKLRISAGISDERVESGIADIFWFDLVRIGSIWSVLARIDRRGLTDAGEKIFDARKAAERRGKPWKGAERPIRHQASSTFYLYLR